MDGTPLTTDAPGSDGGEPGPHARPRWLPDTPCARLIAARDWADSPLGPPRTWPASLRAMLGTVLRAPMPMAVLWGEHGIALYNDGFALALGERHPDALGHSVLNGAPDLSELGRRALRAGLAGEALSLRGAELSPGGDGKAGVTRFDIDALPVLDDDGEPAGALVRLTDAAARATAEPQGHGTDAQLRALADNLPGAVVYRLVTSRDLLERRYTYVSAGVGSVLGIADEEALSDPLLWLSRVEPADQARLYEAERAAARDLATLDVEVRSRHPDGRLLVGRIISRPSERPDGRLL